MSAPRHLSGRRRSCLPRETMPLSGTHSCRPLSRTTGFRAGGQALERGEDGACYGIGLAHRSVAASICTAEDWAAPFFQQHGRRLNTGGCTEYYGALRPCTYDDSKALRADPPRVCPAGLEQARAATGREKWQAPPTLSSPSQQASTCWALRSSVTWSGTEHPEGLRWAKSWLPQAGR